MNSLPSQILNVSWHFNMILQNIKKFFNNTKFEATKLAPENYLKGYPTKVEIKNAFKSNLLFLIAAIILSVYLLSNISTYKSKWPSIAFCTLLTIYAAIIVFNRSPKLTLSKEGVLIKNRTFLMWSEIISTQIEEMDSETSTYRLHITYNDKTEIINLTGLNYSKGEISHLIEYFKEKNAS